MRVVRVEGLEGDWIPVENSSGVRWGYAPGNIVAGGVTRIGVRLSGDGIQDYWVTVGNDKLFAASQRIASGLPGFKSVDYIEKEKAIREHREAEARRAARDTLAGEGW